MRNQAEAVRWVVYLMTMKGKEDGAMNAVCEQREWDAMERERPGYHKLIQSGIINEGEAERLARGTAGDRAVRRRGQERTSDLLEPLDQHRGGSATFTSLITCPSSTDLVRTEQ
jgi:hypothetical protein